MDVDRWLEDRLGALRLGGTTLVLCRSRATVARVRRHLAERGGAIGVDVLTPHGLVAAIHRPPLGWDEPEPTPLPATDPMARRIGDRPGLIAVARRWVRRLRELRAVGHAAPAPDWLERLAATAWAADGSEAAVRAALERLRADPLHPTESIRYDRAVLLGFDAGLAVLDPVSRAVAAAVSGANELAAEAPASERPIPTARVPDVVAEARLATTLCLQQPRHALVLVSEAATAHRLRDALARNGLGAGFVDPPPAAASALGGLVLRITPWFTQVDPPLRVSDLAWVFTHPALSGGLCPAGEQHVANGLEALGLSADLGRLGRRNAAALLREARVLDAPLSRWLGRLEVLARQASRSPSVRGAAVALKVRLQLLQSWIAGSALPPPLQGGPGWDDFDALVAELLGDTGPIADRNREPRSLGALGQFVVDLRPRVHDDAAARVVLGALRDRAAVQADPATVREALGSPIDPPALGAGVDVLAIDDYDGRPSGRLILLDVHHQGIARRPTPDPLLDDGELASLGVLAGPALVDFRMATVWRAAARAQEVIAIVAHRDAGGRDLVPPIQLRLEPLGVDEVGTYGLRAPLPERRRAGAVERRVGGEATAPDPDHPVAHLATQATLAWYREGRGPRPPAPGSASRYDGLQARLAALGPPGPDWLMPWLGHADGVPDAALPDRPWSASGLFEPMAACLYRAYAGAVLGVRKAEEIPEDLDPREVGSAIHAALQDLGVGLQLRVPHDLVPQVRDDVAEALRAATRARLDEVRRDLEGLSEARQAAVTGREARWSAHWPSWAASRVRSAAISQREADFQVSSALREHPYVAAALEALTRTSAAVARQSPRALQQWLIHQAIAVARGADSDHWTPETVVRTDEEWGELPLALHADLAGYLRTDAFREVRLAAKALGIRAEHAGAVLVATGVEIPFGPARGEGHEPGRIRFGDAEERDLDLGEVAVVLGSGPVALSGRVDRLVVTQHGERHLIEILDYKTGGSPGRKDWQVRQDLMAGRRPQLVVYALALQAAVAANRLGPGLEGALVASVGWDHVRDTFDDSKGQRTPVPNAFGRFLVDKPTLDAIGARMGELLDRARAGHWTLQPHPESCPHVAWSAFCDVADACRFKALPDETAPGVATGSDPATSAAEAP